MQWSHFFVFPFLVGMMIQSDYIIFFRVVGQPPIREDTMTALNDSQNQLLVDSHLQSLTVGKLTRRLRGWLEQEYDV